MQKLNLLILTFLFIAFLHTDNVFGQVTYGKLKLHVIQSFSGLWTGIELTNKDTTYTRFVPPNLNRPILDSIPMGQYKARLFSVFGDKIEKQVTIKRKANLTFNVKDFYQIDTTSIKFLTRLGSKDTLKIFAKEIGCYYSATWSCSILHTDSAFIIQYDTWEGFKEFSLTESELDRFLQLENFARTPKNKNLIPYSTTSTYYSWVLDKKIIEFRLSGQSYISDLYHTRQKSDINTEKE